MIYIKQYTCNAFKKEERKMYKKCEKKCLYFGMKEAIMYCSLVCDGVPKENDIRMKAEYQSVDIKPIDPFLDNVR